MKLGVVQVNLAELAAMLGLPDTVHIKALHYDPIAYAPRVRIMLEGEPLPLVAEGAEIPHVVMEYGLCGRVKGFRT